MPDKSPFKVTSKAGPFVAGQRSPGAGKTIRLTEAQAHYPLILGEIERPDDKAKASNKGETAAGKDA